MSIESYAHIAYTVTISEKAPKKPTITGEFIYLK